MDDYIYVGSFELRWKHFNRKKWQLKTESSWVLVNYNMKYDSILEEHVMFERNNESLTLTKTIVITDFEKQVVACYSEFIVNNIKLLRAST